MVESGVVNAICPMVGDGPCLWVNTLMKYVLAILRCHHLSLSSNQHSFLDGELLLWF